MIAVPPALEVYYAATCAPCRLELPVLAAALREGAPVRVMLLTEEKRARAELAAISPDLAAQAVAAPAGQDPRIILRQAGDADGILPFARTSCAGWRGTLTLERIRTLLAGCPRP